MQVKATLVKGWNIEVRRLLVAFFTLGRTLKVIAMSAYRAFRNPTSKLSWLQNPVIGNRRSESADE